MNLAVVGENIINYEYDCSGVRVAKNVNGCRTELINNGDSVIAELCEGEVTNYYRGLSLIGYEADDELFYYSLNAHGDTIGIVDGFGNQVKTYSYDAFGNQADIDELDTNPFRYCGEYFDNETELIYLRARYYDPGIQRLVSEDTHWTPSNMIYGDNQYQEKEIKPISFKAVIQSCNFFGYCMNNPVNYLDSTGKAAESILYTSWSLGIEAFVVDGPFPVGDIIGASIIGVGTLIAGGIWVHGAITSFFTTTREDENTGSVSISTTRKSDPQLTVIYRLGNGNATNLTPREIDITGLSYTTIKPEKGPYTRTTIEAVNATGCLVAIKDGSNHVSVIALDPVKMQEWIQSRPTALENPHEYTLALQEISIKQK